MREKAEEKGKEDIANVEVKKKEEDHLVLPFLKP